MGTKKSAAGTRWTVTRENETYALRDAGKIVATGGIEDMQAIALELNMGAPAKRRLAYYAIQDHHYKGKPHVVMVYADDPGYVVVNPDTDLGGPFERMKEAEEAAAAQNARIGVSEAEAVAIVSASMQIGTNRVVAKNGGRR